MLCSGLESTGKVADSDRRGRRTEGSARRGTAARDPAGRPPEGSNEHERVLPSAALAPFVAHFWSVRWALEEPLTVETLPHPSVHVVFEEQGRRRRAEVAGVGTGRFVRQLTGEGRVFGIKFRPGAFHELLGAPVTSLTDRVAPIGEVLGRDGKQMARAVFGAVDLETKIAIAESFLERCLSPLPLEIQRVRDLVERMATDRSLLRVEQAASALAVDLRTLQRRFRQYVGVSPKSVILRYRLHEAAERLKGPKPPSLAVLAAELGYADQAHFAREFKTVVGRTPRRFVEMEGHRGDGSPKK